MITRRNLTLILTVLAVGLDANRPVTAQSYPAKPVRFIVPFPPGGSTDVGARLIAEHLSRALGQQVYVENRSGANGNIGVEAAAKSTPDGYTILVTTDIVMTNPHVFGTSIDPSKDLVPVIQLSRQPIVLAAHPSLGVNSLAKLVAMAKQQPGLRYATGSGLGSPQHIAVQWFARIAGITVEQVPYRGGAQAINDLVAGHVKLGSLGSTPVIPHYKADKLRLLAQTTQARSPSLPDVPTFEEAGIKGLVLDQWLGVFAPAGTPPAIAVRLNTMMNKALADPAVRKGFLDSAQDPVGGSADQFARLVGEDFAKYGRLVKELNICPGASTFGAIGGLTCYLMPELTRDALFEALRQWRHYGTTGARIFLDLRASFDQAVTAFSEDPQFAAAPEVSVREALMGDIIRPGDVPMRLTAEVIGTAPIERVDVLHGMQVIQMVRPYGASDLGRRVRVLWQGAECRGRGRETHWHGRLVLTGNRFSRFAPVNFLNPERQVLETTTSTALAWTSVTTGNLAGIDIWLDEVSRGTLSIETNIVSKDIDLTLLGACPSIRKSPSPAE
jgi:tripartite-type tricarboxylate transporter receptor subunit TctC